MVWFNNVPHMRLVEDKGGQNWISRKNDKFIFPGGGTQFIHGADQYLDQISNMVPGIAFGQNTRVALDVGCGVASFGAYLLSRNVTTLSIAPKDVHENQIQFALERGNGETFLAYLLGTYKEGYIAIWRKPLNNNCYVNRHPQLQPPICEANDDPDNVCLKACITPLPENGYGANVTSWPTSLHYPPDRLLTIKMDAYNSRKEIFRAESKYWNDLVNGYVNAFNWKDLHL
ncbi:unnamed protein product [Camellia sinensis]